MHRAEYIRAVAQKTNIAQQGAKLIVDTMLGVIYDALAQGEPVDLMEFGVFEVRDPHELPEGTKTRKVIFVPGPVLAEAVNRPKAKSRRSRSRSAKPHTD